MRTSTEVDRAALVGAICKQLGDPAFGVEEERALACSTTVQTAARLCTAVALVALAAGRARLRRHSTGVMAVRATCWLRQRRLMARAVAEQVVPAESAQVRLVHQAPPAPQTTTQETAAAAAGMAVPQVEQPAQVALVEMEATREAAAAVAALPDAQMEPGQSRGQPVVPPVALALSCWDSPKRIRPAPDESGRAVARGSRTLQTRDLVSNALQHSSVSTRARGAGAQHTAESRAGVLSRRTLALSGATRQNIGSNDGTSCIGAGHRENEFD